MPSYTSYQRHVCCCWLWSTDMTMFALSMLVWSLELQMEIWRGPDGARAVNVVVFNCAWRTSRLHAPSLRIGCCVSERALRYWKTKQTTLGIWTSSSTREVSRWVRPNFASLTRFVHTYLCVWSLNIFNWAGNCWCLSGGDRLLYVCKSACLMPQGIVILLVKEIHKPVLRLTKSSHFLAWQMFCASITVPSSLPWKTRGQLTAQSCFRYISDLQNSTSLRAAEGRSSQHDISEDRVDSCVALWIEI